MALRKKSLSTCLSLVLGILSLLLLVCLVKTGASRTQWKQAAGPRNWSFPKDHGSHPDFRTEWWYFTGNLTDGSEKRFGYQLTFFRHGIVWRAKNPNNTWSVRDLFPAHFTLTDVSAGQFWYAERIARQGPGLAGAAGDGMDVWMLNWSARMKNDTIRMEARDKDKFLSLELIPRKPMVFHGQNGLSRKGPIEGQASYYFSYTDLATRGSIRTPLSQTQIPVTGTSWFDHEFGSNQMTPDQVGWDWFSLHLSDGHDLMLYALRRKDGSVEPTSSGTLVSPSGKATHLKLSEVNIEVLDYWKSPRSGGRYPSRWRLRIPTVGIDLLISPSVASQELLTEGSTGVVYYEGAIEGKGTSGGKEVTSEGYVEMTGYAGSLAGLF